MTPRARAVLARIAAENRLAVSDLTGRSRLVAVARARQQAYAELYALKPHERICGPYSLPQIGALFGRHHSTVHHGIRAHEARQRAGEGA